MTERELNLAIFEGTAEGVLWQPRLEEWIGYHRKHKTLPERFQDLDDLDIYDRLGYSVRYAASVGLKQYDEPSDVEYLEERIDETHRVSIIRIPEGELRTIYQEIYKDGILENSRIVEFPVKTVDDLRLLTSLINRQHYRADIEEFTRAANKVGDRLKREKRFVDTHWDGHSRLILPFLQETGLSGVEALTPEPMGDMTLKEIKEAVKENIVVSDLIPVILFLQSYSVKEVVEYARRVIDMFAPRLILGISDELSAVGQIEKVEAISELVNERRKE